MRKSGPLRSKKAMPMQPALILAGGRARRLGGADKALVPLAGRPLLAHVRERLTRQAAPVFVSANGDPARFSRFGLEILPDTVAGHPGPLAGILAGLAHAEREGFATLLTVAVDTPFFPEDLLARLSAAGSTPDEFAVAATRDAAGDLHVHPTFGLWPTRLAPAISEALAADMRRMRTFIGAHGAGLALFPDEKAFFNINTEEDRLSAERRVMRGTR